VSSDSQVMQKASKRYVSLIFNGRRPPSNSSYLNICFCWPLMPGLTVIWQSLVCTKMNARMLQSETEQDIILHHFSHTNPNKYSLHEKLACLFLFQIQLNMHQMLPFNFLICWTFLNQLWEAFYCWDSKWSKICIVAWNQQILWKIWRE